MTEVKVTQADREVADTICNPTDNPHLYSVLCKKFARHRQAAEIAAMEAMKETCASVDPQFILPLCYGVADGASIALREMAQAIRALSAHDIQKGMGR